jgi:hypothetical protein
MYFHFPDYEFSCLLKIMVLCPPWKDFENSAHISVAYCISNLLISRSKLGGPYYLACADTIWLARTRLAYSTTRLIAVPFLVTIFGSSGGGLPAAELVDYRQFNKLNVV